MSPFITVTVSKHSTPHFIELYWPKTHKVLRLTISNINNSYIIVVVSNIDFANDYYNNLNITTIETTILTILEEKIAKYEYSKSTKEHIICYFKIIDREILLQLL